MSSTAAPLPARPSANARGTSRTGTPATRRARPVARLSANGEPMLWLGGGALALCCVMVVGLIALVFVQGVSTFWPTSLIQLRTLDGSAWMGEVTRTNVYEPEATVLASLPTEVRDRATANLSATEGVSTRRLLRIGNYELTGEHFAWVSDFMIADETEPAWAVVVERMAGGRFYGVPSAFLVDGKVVETTPEAVWAKFEAEHPKSRARFHERHGLERVDLGAVAHREEAARLAIRRAELQHGAGSPEHAAAERAFTATKAECETEIAAIRAQIDALNAENRRTAIELTTASGQTKQFELSQFVRAYPANQLSFFGKVGVYVDRWSEFLLDEPREANSEGGIYAALFGTVLMTLLMSLVVVPFGVLAALYMREYAKAGLVVSTVRVAVNNLAGVPSIVFGVFGLGFFCYLVGASIDQLLFAEKLPNPTFGTGGLMWASLTLALLTLPVVIVATEEALSAVPRSMREGSYACGASKWQTIRRIVLPRAMPGIMTGMILAMARGAGEVAPLMLVGVVKMAPAAPLDGTFPFLHMERSFMHLGFHIYDQGFQSQNSEAAKPMVFTTTLLLIGVIAVLNVTAVWLRSRLRRRFAGAQF